MKLGAIQIVNKDLETNLYKFEDAWAWARAKSWVASLLNEDELQNLEIQLKQKKDGLIEKQAELISAKAWFFCQARMDLNTKSHLEGWKQSMKKLGKGTGKHAPKHRRDAKNHLNKSKDGIPAWIMPLHKVFDTVNFSPGMFDLIVVDESSQCGSEAIPLTFLAKKILVVGDDQQISPEGVGADQSRVTQLMEEYLKTHDHKDSFDMATSFFEQCKRYIEDRIVLVEHFRCMPEIIRFSNDLCYSSTPLIPLRQYSPNRLKPLESVYVDSGFREGKGNTVLNKPEADAIVDTVVDCMSKPEYKGKTFGVISLQGEMQGTYIENKLLDKLGGDEYHKRNIVCGNPYSFQGDERDVIFLSMVAAPNERIGPLSKSADMRRFNVAASRAKDQMWLFHSVTTNDLSNMCLRSRLLEFFENPEKTANNCLVGADLDSLRDRANRANRGVEKPPKPFDSWFEVDVALKIVSKGYRVIPQYPAIEGKRIDLVIEGEELGKLAVECDGDFWHGPEKMEADLERQRTLERAKWHFFRVRESMFYYHPDECLEKLWEDLDARSIFPIYGSGTKQPISSATSEVRKENTSDTNNPSKTHEDNKSSVNKANKGNEFYNMGEPKQFQIFADDFPNTVKEAIRLSNNDLATGIVHMLLTRPNHTSKKDDVFAHTLKMFGIRCRGAKREKFQMKVNRVLKKMENDGVIEEYKAKNIRVKLLDSSTL